MAYDDRVFISHSGADLDFVLKLTRDLKAAGVSVWLHTQDRVPGTRWDLTIEDALTNCPRLLVILSPTAVSSRHVMDEVSFALEEEKTVIPVMYQDCKVPFGLRRIQYLDFRQDYVGALQDLVVTLAPTQGGNSSKPAILEPEHRNQAAGLETGAREAADKQARLENGSRQSADRARADKRLTPVPQTQANRKGASGALSQSKEGFCLPWRSNGRVAGEIQNAAVLMTNISSLTSADLSRIANKCRDSGKTLVVVAPTLGGSMAKTVASQGGLVVEATDLDGQPMSELIEDLGAYLGGVAWLRELGLGIPNRQQDRDSPKWGVVSQFQQIADLSVKDDLGSALVVSNDANQTSFKAHSPSPYVRNRIKALKYRATHCATSHDEFNGLIERLRRFGAVGSIKENLVERVAFAHDADEVILPAGFASPYFITDWAHQEGRIKNPKILVTTYPLCDLDSIVPVLQNVAEQLGINLVVFSLRIHEEVLATLIVNKLRGIVLCLAVEAENSEQLSAIAHLTGARLVDESNAHKLLGASVGSLLGNAAEVVAEFHKTTIKK